MVALQILKRLKETLLTMQSRMCKVRDLESSSCEVRIWVGLRLGRNGRYYTNRIGVIYSSKNR